MCVHVYMPVTTYMWQSGQLVAADSLITRQSWPSGLSASAFPLCAILLTQDLIHLMKIDRHTHLVSEPISSIRGEIK